MKKFGLVWAAFVLLLVLAVFIFSLVNIQMKEPKGSQTPQTSEVSQAENK